MSNAQPNPARIRRATNDDLEELSVVLVRSFARDTTYNWIRGVTRTISSANTTDPEELKDLEQLRYLQWSLARLYLLCGQVDVVVIPIEGRERIVACTTWVEPGKATDPGLWNLSRLRLFRVWKAWGLQSFKVSSSRFLHFTSAHTHVHQRMVLEFVPQTEKIEKQAFKARGKELKDAWHLGIVSTDPDHEGHGML